MNILFFLIPKSDVAYIYENCTLRQALTKMKHYRFTAIPVIKKDGKYAGTLSEGDLLWAFVDNGLDMQKQKLVVRNMLRSRQNMPVNVNASIEDLFLMAVNQNFIPVTDDRGLFIGIVKRSDILNYYYKNISKPKLSKEREFESKRNATLKTS